MARLLFLLVNFLASTTALNCYMAQSTDSNYVPSDGEIEQCPVSSTACFRTVVNTTFDGFQVSGARYGCDSPMDSLCQSGMTGDCQPTTTGTCCCSTDYCNGTPNPGTDYPHPPNTPITANDTTVPTRNGLICYTGSTDNIQEIPNNVGELMTCPSQAKDCFTLTQNGTKTFGCDTTNLYCKGQQQAGCTASDDGTVLCCCGKDYCNGDPNPKTDAPPPVTRGLLCYSGLKNSANYTPYNVNELTACQRETTDCYVVFSYGQTQYGCDEGNTTYCQTMTPNTCQTINGIKLCCCIDDYCNGSPTPGQPYSPTTTTRSLPARTTAPPSSNLACYTGNSYNINYYPTANEIQSCSGGANMCFRTFMSDILHFGCDSFGYCLGRPSGHCFDTISNGRMCCCGEKLCNGRPFGDYQPQETSTSPQPSSAFGRFTLLSAVVTIVLHNFV